MTKEEVLTNIIYIRMSLRDKHSSKYFSKNRDFALDRLIELEYYINNK